MRNKQWGRDLAGIVLLAGAGLLYLLTLDNGLRPGELAGGDLITHQYAQVQGRPSNAPGYPLYTMGGWLWFHLGRLLLGSEHNPIPILASYSTLWALLALWLLYRLILETTDRGDGGNWAVALLASGFYAVTYFFWYYATTTEQYASAVAWTLAMFLLAFRWQRSRRVGHLLAMAGLAGAGLAHMVTILLAVPPLLWFLLREEPRLLRRPRLIAAGVAAAAAPLLSYLFVYVRGAQHPEWRGTGQWASTWEWFWSFISTQQGRGELTWSLTPLLTPEFPALIWRELTWVGLAAGLAGLALLGRRRAVLAYATLAVYLVFCWIDRLGNWYQVIMPAYALLVLGIGVAADRVAIQRARHIARDGHAHGGQRSSKSAAQAAVLLVLGVLLVYRGAVSYPGADSRDRAGDTGLEPAWAILADAPPAGARILGTQAETLALNYVTEIWGIRADLRTVTAEEARTLLAEGGTPLAVTTAALPLVPTEVSPQAHYSALGPALVRLYKTAQMATREEATAAASTQGGVDAVYGEFAGHDFGNEMRLVGGYIREDAATAASVMLVWQALATPSEDWSVSVRLAQGGAEIAQIDQAHPVASAYPTSRWAAGEVVCDAYRLELPPGATPDSVTVIVYRRQENGEFANLDVARLPLGITQAQKISR